MRVLKTSSTAKLVLAALLIALLLLAGCVERELTINTKPQGAVVLLNDEEIGTSPATVSFNWYGDYNVRINKEGYEPIATHRKLKRPWYDYFPFDFFAQILPCRTVNAYQWSFDLKPKTEPSREELIRKAEQTRNEVRQQATK